MKFDMTNSPKAIADGPRVGDVYPGKGGGRTVLGEIVRYWLVLAAPPGRVHLAGLNADGQILTTTSYGSHVLNDRRRLGRCPEIAALEDICLAIEWDESP